MSRPIVLAYAAEEHRAAIREACGDAHVRFDANIGDAAREPSVLVAVAGRCSAFAAALDEFVALGNSSVRAIVLIAPEAPWAEREWVMPVRGAGRERLPLGPLEALRPWVARARASRQVSAIEAATRAVAGGVSRGDYALLGPRALRGSSQDPTLRLILTAHPEPVACRDCGGGGETPSGTEHFGARESLGCCTCSGTGRALGPAEVARELIGGLVIPPRQAHGGLDVLSWNTRRAHDDNAIASAMRLALEGL